MNRNIQGAGAPQASPARTMSDVSDSSNGEQFNADLIII
ncbi:MAG: hypothetical protein RIR70_2047 [Pseudomonadota bacterium]|jgi:hypothetical protein